MSKDRKPWQHDKRSRHERGYGYEWIKLRERVLKRDGYQCQECKRQGRLTAATQVDHIVPKAKGGTDTEGNCQSLCKPCHDEKTARDEGRRHITRVRIGTDGFPIWD